MHSFWFSRRSTQTSAGAFASTDPLASPAGVEQVSPAPDIQDYVDAFHVDALAATVQLEELPRILALQRRLADDAPEEFAGLWIDHDPYAVSVAVTSETGEIGQMITAAGLSVSPSIRVVKHSLSELDSILGALVRSDAVFNGAVNERMNRIDVQVRDINDLAAFGRSDLAADESVAVQVVEDLGGPATDILGGLGGAEHNWSGCMSGFTIKKYGTTTKGFVTAGHCGNTLSYQGSNLPFKAEQISYAVDAQWHTAPGFTVQPRFIVNQNQGWRTLQNRADTVMGQRVCKYGAVTYYSCATVNNLNFHPNWVPNGQGFVTAYNCDIDMVKPGDSGGPVFFNYTAYGITSGYYGDIFTCWGKWMLVYGELGNIAYSLGVEILHSP